MCFSVLSAVASSPLAPLLKGATVSRVFQHVPEVKKQLWGRACWSRSYYIGSVGDRSVETVLKYIELGHG
jgi:REP element-mobilizing transposase RayT